MKRYVKKPVAVDAWKTPEDTEELLGVTKDVKRCKLAGTCKRCKKSYLEHLEVHTLEGNMTACPGDYIIRGVNGEFYPCKPDIFEKTYVLADTMTDESK